MKASRAFVTGAAGFVGSNLVDRLLARGDEVVGYDDFSTGREPFLEDALRSPRFTLVRGDCLDGASLTRAAAGCDVVFHLAANADVRYGTLHPRKDLEQNTIATFNVLEAARENRIPRFVFASTGSVYGEATVLPTPESCPFPVQTSTYGAAKLACEGMIEAYAEGFGLKAYVFRFVSVLGERYTHGHVRDFYQQLLAHPGELFVLGNGRQRKSYVYIHDCIDGILATLGAADGKVNRFNVGTEEWSDVDDSIRWITEHLGLSPKIAYAGGERGWVGDNPFVFLDVSRLRGLGWRPKLTIREAVVRTLSWLEENRWALEA